MIPSTSAAALLSVESIDAGYGHIDVLGPVSLEVLPATIVALVGRNGAGKSTVLRAISGLIKPVSGTIRFDGGDITGVRPNVIVSRGLLHVAEGRRLFRTQTVSDNLQLGCYGLGVSQIELRRRLDRAHALFPILHNKRGEAAGALSGGQQQMLAIAQAMMREPKLLMLDEPSLGLAPVFVDQVLDAIVNLRRSGVAILLVEQMVERALEISDQAYVLQNGRVVTGGPAGEIATSATLQAAYLHE